MSSEENQMSTTEAADIEQIALEDQMARHYTSYAMSVIVARALPDVRDGLKPVQRRILYAANEMGISSGSSHRKSSSLVGETMGDYHPHGDSAIYDTLVNMAQDFSMNQPLIDGQGNFGSMDGDPAAAMRYTEARLSPIAEDLLNDIDQETVDFSDNYDGRVEEPDVLPAAFPNILVNGGTGIAVGMSTSIPPHNLQEVIDATIHRINNPNSTIKDLMEHIPGPDFPTGATIIGRDGIKEAYETGSGSVRVRADYHVERENNRIILTEIPYKKKKADLVEDIAEAAESGRVEGITDVRDESDRNGVRVVIDIKARANIDVAENQLIQTALEKTVSMNHIALVDGQPRRLSLPQMLDEYIEHRREVVRRRTQYQLGQKEDRLHIVNGRIKALGDIDDVVETIRNSEDRASAVEALKEEYDFSDEQANHITRMQLSSLTGLQREELRTERGELNTEIEELNRILDNPEALDSVIIEELEEIGNEHGTERRTSITDDYASVEDEDLIPQEDSLVLLTDNNYMKRMSADTFRIQQRNGKGIIGMNGDDTVASAEVVNTHDRILLFTDTGDVHELKGYEIPESSRQAHGTSAINIVDIETDEQVIAMTTVPEETDDDYLTLVTENGYVKRTELDQFNNIYSTGIKAVTLGDDDSLVAATITSGDEDLMLASREGQVIRFPVVDVRATGRTSRGVHGIKLTGDDSVVSMTTVPDDDATLLTVTENGIGKRTEAEEYSQQSRNGKGMMAVNDTTTTGNVVTVTRVGDAESVFLVSDTANVIRTELADISLYGRISNGVNVMDLSDGDTLRGAGLL